MIEMSRVNIPLGGNTEVYTDPEDRRYFNYANVRKASYRGMIYIVWTMKDDIGKNLLN